MVKYVDGIVARLYVGYRIDLIGEDGRVEEFEIVGSRKVRKSYKYLIKNVDSGEINSLNREVALHMMEKKSMKVHAMG